MTALRSLLMALIVLGASPPAWGQGKPELLEGRAVFGAEGVILGVVEQVIRRPNGRPVQLLVRPRGKKSAGPRSLAFAGVEAKPEGFQTPLTREEFDAMPTVEIVQEEK